MIISNFIYKIFSHLPKKNLSKVESVQINAARVTPKFNEKSDINLQDDSYVAQHPLEGLFG